MKYFKNKNIVIFITLLLFCNSCATPYIWKKTDPDKYVKIDFSKITEEELQDKEVKYYRDDTQHAFFAEMDSFAKFKNYSLRTLATPIAVILDTTAVILVVAAMVVRKESCDNDLNCHDSNNTYYGKDYWKEKK
ncbi:MAG: hypothetical protein OEM02_11345 [Desulfobulbaceae bacterium]|nr:hypothetical protein [Desulfobulbaceae bacterium]